MIRANRRLRRRLTIATAILVVAAGPGRAQPQPPPPPPPSGPLPTPYPNPEPLPRCPHTFCLPQPGVTQEGGAVASHKHLGGVKYSDFAKSGEASAATMETATVELSDSTGAPSQPVQVIGLIWSKLEGAGPVYSADPMEGGQIAGKDAASASANLAERKTRPGRPTYGNLADTAPVIVAAPVAKGTASFKTLGGVCATGKHLDKVKIVTRSRGFTLHDVTVVSVAPADPVDGRAMEQVTLSYASVGD